MPTTTFDELPSRERLWVWWSFLWRGFVITVCSGLGGAIAGFVIGFVVALVGSSLGHNVREPGVQLLIRALAGTAGFAIGLVLAYQYVRWLFLARLGGFRLLLVREPSGAAV